VPIHDSQPCLTKSGSTYERQFRTSRDGRDHVLNSTPLRVVLQTLRDRLPLNLVVYFSAQLPMLVRGLYYEGWEPSNVPIKMSREQFLEAVRTKIVADRVIDPAETIQSVLAVVAD
jgi:uncharacterized protein (DUF2267 family)